EARRARQRIEAAFGEALELELAVSVGEEREHEKAEPVGNRLVERGEDARLVGVAGMALEQRLGFLASVAAEIGVEQIDHRPEVTAFLDIDLEQIAQIVERRRGMAEQALLLDRGRLGVALSHDEAAQRRAQFARHLLPHRLAEFVAESDTAVLFLLCEENAPAIIRHFYVAERRPAGAIDRDRGAQIRLRPEKIAWSHLAPPGEERRLPMLQRPLERLVAREIDVVGNPFLIVDGHHTRSQSTFAFVPVPNSFNAPCAPVAFGRLKIQFCQADSRPNTRVAMVSGPAKRKLASSPVSASGDRLARSSMARRISSSQSSSSGVTVTRPSASDVAASSGLPTCSAILPSGAASPPNRLARRARPLAIG